ncbi:MAG: DNA-directed RNA polymerase subunit delta [Bacilli bacterium]|nr:DNA-directed RNA polymerase subunit delta [Bacilli bacterium]
MKKDVSMLDAAYEIVTEEGTDMSFQALFAKVAEKLEMDENDRARNISEFYTGLTLDGRFVAVIAGNGEYNWDLRTRHTYNKSHVDLSEAYDSVSSNSGIEAEDKEEQKEFDKSIGADDDDDSDGDDDDEGEEGGEGGDFGGSGIKEEDVGIFVNGKKDFGGF